MVIGKFTLIVNSCIFKNGQINSYTNQQLNNYTAKQLYS